MPIVSLSLNSEILKQLDHLQQEMGFTGRSEAVRAAIRHFSAEQQPAQSGIVDAAIIVVHAHEYTQEFSAIRHKHEHIIKTQLHNHAGEHQCLEILVVRGDAKNVKKLHDELATNKKIDTVKVVVL